MKKILTTIIDFLKKIWSSPVVRWIIKIGVVIITGIIAVLFFISKISSFFSVGNKKRYDNKINDLEKEREKDEKIINNSTANDYDEHGIRIRRKRKKN